MTGEEYRKLRARAHRELFDEYYPYVLTVALSKLHGFPREDVEECVSDVFAEVFMSLDGSSSFSGELKGFIAAVAKRRAVDSFRRLTARKRRFTVSLDDADFDEAADIDIEEETERAERARLLLEAAESLGEPDASIIIRRYYGGESLRQIADSLGMKPSAVRMRCSRALKRLKTLLKGVI